MHCHCGTNNRAPRWTFTDPCKPEVRSGARGESASPAWLAAPAMNVREKRKCVYGGLTLDMDGYALFKSTCSKTSYLTTCNVPPELFVFLHRVFLAD